MTDFLAPTATMEAVGEDIPQGMISTGIERVPVALQLTAIMCSDL
jgi:hypothetical protein